MSWEPILNSFSLVLVSEIGDKTQLLAFYLASRFRKPVAIMLGILVATLINHALAASVGSWVSGYFSARVMALVLGITFLSFGIWTLKPDTYEGTQTDHPYGAFFTTAILFFIAEMGDKTQLATVALGVKYQSTIQVTLGTTLGMLIADGLAVFLGEKLSNRAELKWARIIAAIFFFTFSIFSFITFFQLQA